ncbi:MAG: preprotein translocase subunit SecA [Elusimicrobia bacterium RIFOXYC2_FULL_34_12]|nr:MAG: preprotein translocase subunit SecA [Elusimicrobia bacterium RIFOXYC2_FULL_34_12]OGS37856.1 MAG: preprotein translocase subunit SecA [Elusimicrobia bacterium RIFOXYD2_FULL_34_30]HAM39173.1 preprotein translocase subunit SecA [Elusimicrobiota bacterium]
MINYIFKKLFGTKSERDIKKIFPFIEKINSFEETIKKLSDDALKLKTEEFKNRISKGETLEDILPEAFAVVRESSKRTIGLRHFDAQLLGGIILHQGKISEMKTGEGKTLVATLSAYLNSLSGKGVHIITVNDYLAKRDRSWMGPVFEFLGLTVGYLQHDMSDDDRKLMYACDVTYVTNSEIGFDYLRDNMKRSKEERVLRKLNYAIVDEVDSILIDEARTPLIISGPAEESTDKYYIINKLIPNLKGKFITEAEEIDAKHKGLDLTVGFDYIVDERNHSASMTSQGVAKCEKMLGIQNLYDDIQSEWIHHINQAIKAHNLFKRDVDYVVKDGEVIIVDEFTGRLMPGRRWSEGLHQAVESKENLRIAEENQTLATITYQNFFKLYNKISGMTGTAMTEAGEFWHIYKLDVVEIPTNKPMVRSDYPDSIYRTEKEKYEAIINEIEELYKLGRPVLVGTRSIEKNEKLSAMLKRRGVPHQLLNAKYHEQEAQIIAQAGRKKAVTVATNMAGRGTDIILGGNPTDLAEQTEIKELGGLHILGTERHEARRIDNQLRGRGGRQGDMGSSRFFLSLEDELMRLFGSDRIAPIMERLGMKEGEVIEHPLVSRAIENAQRKVEEMNFEIRKNLLQYDNVMNKQREVIYALRNSILDGADVSEKIWNMINELLDEKIEIYCPEKTYPENWDIETIIVWTRRTFGLDLKFSSDEINSLTYESFREILDKNIKNVYNQREIEFTKDIFENIERQVMLQVIDNAWKNHLYDLDQLRKGIGLRAYGQKDPLVEYKKESLSLFITMMDRIREETVEYIFRVQVMPQSRVRPALNTASRRAGTGPAVQNLQQNKQESPAMPTKIGRNDSCPCGSGKKYKKCCGR